MGEQTATLVKKPRSQASRAPQEHAPGRRVALQRRAPAPKAKAPETEAPETKSSRATAPAKSLAGIPVFPPSQSVAATTPEDHLPPMVNEALRSGSGKPMDGATRTFMESRFGRNLGQVRIHTDAASAESARSIGAKAYAVGSHVVFGDRAYSRDHESGQRLLAHELTHVVQRSNNSSGKIASIFSQRGDASEDEAERIANRVVSGPLTGEPPISAVPRGLVQGQWEYVKDAWKHGKKAWANRGKESGEGEKEPEGAEEDWAEPSEEVALHTKEFLEGAKLVFEQMAKSKKGDPEAAEEMTRLAEGFEKASSLVEAGEKGFDKIKKAVEVMTEISELWDAVNELRDIDVSTADSDRSARAFDNLFGAVGSLADRLPDGPWKGYFELLKHFKDHGGFFLNVSRGLTKEAREARRVSENTDYREPAPVVEPKTAAAPKSLEEVGPDVERKFNLVSEGLRGRTSAADLERFRAAYENLVKLENEARGNVFQRMVRRNDPAPTEEIKAAANQVWDALQALDIAMTMNPDSPQEVSLWPDMLLIERYKGDE